MLSSLDAQREASQELEPDETLIWAGKPDPARAAWSAGTPLLFFCGLVLTSFSLLWSLAVAQSFLHPSKKGGPSGIEIAFPFFGVPLILVGRGFLSAPYWAYRLASKTIYAITSKRLLVITDLHTRKVRSLSPDTISSINLRERSGGEGDLVFHLDPAPE